MTTESQRFDTLIVVCCHAIWLGGPTRGANESEWLIESFQNGETPTFVHHIRSGVEGLSKDPRSILVFSGGATKPKSTPLTEAEGYYNLALANNLFGFDEEYFESQSNSIRSRIFQERFATDSYQNILFSLVQFPYFVQQHRKKTSVPDEHSDAKLDSVEGNPALIDNPEFPTKLIIISHEFKRSRFLDLHLPAIKWNGPTKYIGINPPFDPIKIAEIEEGDRKRGYGVWKDDLYGNGEILMQKRIARGYNNGDFENSVLGKLHLKMRGTCTRLLVWSGNARISIFPEILPWERGYQ